MDTNSWTGLTMEHNKLNVSNNVHFIHIVFTKILYIQVCYRWQDLCYYNLLYLMEKQICKEIHTYKHRIEFLDVAVKTCTITKAFQTTLPCSYCTEPTLHSICIHRFWKMYQPQGNGQYWQKHFLMPIHPLIRMKKFYDTNWSFSSTKVRKCKQNPYIL